MVVAAAAGRRAEVSNHVRFFRMHLKMLPQPYLSLDTSRMTALYFCVVGLDILGELEREVKEAERLALIEWIYGLQVLDEAHGGFRGSGWAGGPLGAGHEATAPFHDLDQPHLAMTYCALCTLLTLGDDLGRVRRAAVARGVRRARAEDGSFSAAAIGCERDLRFVFCACAISRLVGDFSGVDAARTLGHLGSCQAYDGGLGLAPGGESHGGSTYCGIAARAQTAIGDDRDAVFLGGLDAVHHGGHLRHAQSWPQTLSNLPLPPHHRYYHRC